MTFDGVVYASQLMLCTRGLVAFGCVKFGGRLPSFDDVYLFSSETVSNLSELIQQDFKAAAISVWAFWCFEVYTIMASYLGVDEVAGQVVLRGLGLLTFMIPVSIMFGTAIIIGNVLGEGRASIAM